MAIYNTHTHTHTWTLVQAAMGTGSVKGRYHVARCYYNGISVHRDAAKAAQVMGKAVWDLGRNSSYESQHVDRATSDARNYDNRADHNARNRDTRTNNDARNQDNRTSNDARNQDNRTDNDARNQHNRTNNDARNPDNLAHVEDQRWQGDDVLRDNNYSSARNHPDSNSRTSTQNRNNIESSRDGWYDPRSDKYMSDNDASQRPTRLPGEPYMDGTRNLKVSQAHEIRAHKTRAHKIQAQEIRAHEIRAHDKSGGRGRGIS